MDLSILDHDSPLLAWSPPGNFKVAGVVPYAVRILAYRELWAQVLSLLHACECYEDILDDPKSFDQFWYSVQQGCSPYSAQYHEPSTASLALAADPLMVKCLDKVPNNLTVVCIHWAASQVITHLDSACYSTAGVQDEHSQYLERLRIDLIIPDDAP